MMFLNTWEIDDAKDRWHSHPVLGPATATLANLRDAADANSDGWAYWPKPARAGKKLMELIQGDGTHEAQFGEREDATEARLRAAYTPIRSFSTRTGIAVAIVEANR